MSLNEPLEFATNLALEVGDLLLGYYDTRGVHASSKSDHTVVTDADLAADRYISEKITQRYPADAIISEESSHLYSTPSADVWVIDPLDGTTNFSLGLPVWGISIARMVNGIPEQAVLYFPRLQELYSAERNSGAYLNSNPITVKGRNPAEPMSFFSCCSRCFRTFDISIPYKPRIMGSTAYSFCMVARGAALLALDVTPKVWDIAAAWLVVEEAGGVIKPLETGQVFPISTKIDYASVSWTILAAATRKLFDQNKVRIQRKK
jgi:myo-inositol-1(or 4)-monophosphatase